MINAGDFLSLVSLVNHKTDEKGVFTGDVSGTVKSPLHRVDHCGWSKKAASGKEIAAATGDGDVATAAKAGGGDGRWSFVFFSYPRWDLDVTDIIKTAAEAAATRGGRSGEAYNTLTEGGTAGVGTFGEWIERKWAGVAQGEERGESEGGTEESEGGTEERIAGFAGGEL